MTEETGSAPPAKRRKLQSNPLLREATTRAQTSLNTGIDRPISPPSSRRYIPVVASSAALSPTWRFDDVPQQTTTSQVADVQPKTKGARDGGVNYVPSPVQLTRIKDLAPHQNVNTVGLKDILGDPMIKECWNFNFLFDLDFVMKHFDADVKDIVKVKIIHGFWKNDDERRIGLLETAERYPNIELLYAYIPDPFGTHHTKMVVLFRHDDFAQVIIHTANMISRDWGNMTQAVWRSPLLPLLASSPALSSSGDPSDTATNLIGSGERFKVDLIRYFKAYGNRVKSLATQLAQYDFSAIHAAFISSAPSRQKPVAAQPSKQTSFGWLGLQEILSAVPIITKNAGSPSHVVMQVSSIATLGAAPTWLTNFQAVLARSLDALPTSTTVSSTSVSKASSFFSKNTAKAVTTRKPKYNIIFPTPDEIRTSLDGYAAGGSIHIKLQSAQQQKQQEYLHPLFCHWKSSATPSLAFRTEARGGEALRGPAAPHIKTYVRFSDERHDKIDWAMVTSANLSKQAWGDVVNKKDEIWIQSWEAGVVVWPALFANSEAGQEEAVMVPVFGRDTPEIEDVCDTERVGRDDDGYTEQEKEKPQMVVGFRMPYDLPLSLYAADEKPWCATMQYPEPDWKGLAWGGYENVTVTLQREHDAMNL